MEAKSLAEGREAGWAGHVYLDHRNGLYVGKAAASSLHTVHSVVVVLALERSVRVCLDGGGWCEASSVVVPSGRSLASRGDGASCAVFFLHPGTVSATGRSSLLRVSEPRVLPTAVERRLRSMLLGQVGRGCAPNMQEMASGLVERLQRDVPGVELAPLNRRIARLIHALEAEGADEGHAALAASAGLSAGRLTHLFREQTGVALRRYLLWLRGRAAVRRIASGESLTTIAHEAGFADAAHFSRTSRRLLGMPLSRLRREVEFVPA